MESKKELPDVTWKEVYNGNGKTIPSVKITIKDTGVKEIKNGTAKQVLGSSENNKNESKEIVKGF